MEEVLTMRAMRQRYPKEWLLVAYVELDEDMGVRRGQVLAHAPNRDGVYGALLSVKGHAVAIEYTGDIPQDLAVAL